MGNLTEISEKLIRLRRSGSDEKMKGNELVTGTTTSLINNLGSLCPQSRDDADSGDKICLAPPHQVQHWINQNKPVDSMLIRIYREEENQ